MLLPSRSSATAPRSAAFVERYGDVAVELDALPVDVLRARLVTEVEARIDLAALASVREAEARERRRLIEALRSVA